MKEQKVDFWLKRLKTCSMCDNSLALSFIAERLVLYARSYVVHQYAPSLSLSIYIYAYIHTCMYVCMCVCVYTYIHKHTYICIYIHIYVCARFAHVMLNHIYDVAGSLFILSNLWDILRTFRKRTA